MRVTPSADFRQLCPRGRWTAKAVIDVLARYGWRPSEVVKLNPKSVAASAPHYARAHWDPKGPATAVIRMLPGRLPKNIFLETGVAEVILRLFQREGYGARLTDDEHAVAAIMTYEHYATVRRMTAWAKVGDAETVLDALVDRGLLVKRFFTDDEHGYWMPDNPLVLKIPLRFLPGTLECWQDEVADRRDRAKGIRRKAARELREAQAYAREVEQEADDMERLCLKVIGGVPTQDQDRTSYPDYLAGIDE